MNLDNCLFKNIYQWKTHNMKKWFKIKILIRNIKIIKKILNN